MILSSQMNAELEIELRRIVTGKGYKVAQNESIMELSGSNDGEKYILIPLEALDAKRRPWIEVSVSVKPQPE
jgi:hypothetical protein